MAHGLLIPLLLVSLGAAACGETDGAIEPSAPAETGAAGQAQPAVVDRALFETRRNEAFRLQESGEEPGKVLEALLAAHELDPSAYGVNKRLGQVYADLKLYVDALAHYDRAREARPDEMTDRMAVVRILLALNDHERALEELPPLLEAPSTRGEALFQKARVHDFMGDRELALATVAGAEQMEPSLAYHSISLHGRFLAEEGRHAEAEALFRRALEGRVDYKEALRGLADACRRQGRADEADRWDAILGLFLELTDNIFIRKDPALRRALLEQLVADYPQWTPGFHQLALLLRREGEHEQACAVMERFLKLHADLLTPAERDALRAQFCTDTGR